MIAQCRSVLEAGWNKALHLARRLQIHQYNAGKDRHYKLRFRFAEMSDSERGAVEYRP